jgi:hypothetical protein
MAASGMKSSAKTPTDPAIAQIVQMNPRRVTVTLTLPIAGGGERPTVTLEWGREDTNMPLSDLLNRIEAYAAQFGNK